MPGPWVNMSVTFEMTGARIVAILENGGGAVVKEGLALQLLEGRGETLTGLGGDRHLAALEYMLSFGEKVEESREAQECHRARLVISGTHDNGKFLEIRGRGWLGYNEYSELEGFFDAVPTMLIREEELSYGDEEERPKEEPEVMRRRLRVMPNPVPSAQFERAIYGVDPDGTDW